jgi:hypothetical protein
MTTASNVRRYFSIFTTYAFQDGYGESYHPTPIGYTNQANLNVFSRIAATISMSKSPIVPGRRRRLLHLHRLTSCNFQPGGNIGIVITAFFGAASTCEA